MASFNKMVIASARIEEGRVCGCGSFGQASDRRALVSVKPQLSNAFRSYAAEFGIVGPAGRQNVTALIKRVLADDNLPKMARDLFRLQAEEYAAVEARLAKIEAKLMK